MIDLRPDHLEIVRDLLRQHVPGCEVRAFGSRFKWTAKQASDLDLAVVGTKRLPAKKIMRLKEAFEESILPMRVDVLDWHTITSEFQRVINEGFEVIQGGEVSPLAPASSPSAAGSSATPLFNNSLNEAGNSPIQIVTDWPIVQLKAITSKIGSGSTPTGGSSVYLDKRQNFAFIRSQNVFDGTFDTSGIAYISDEQAASLRNVWLEENDVLLNITGDGVTFARSCLVPPSILPACVNQHVSIIRAKQDLASPRYLLAYLMSPITKKYIESFNAGGSRRAITKASIESFSIPLPPISVQKSIAHILGTLEDRIELCRRTNETLESMARALFKDWFIDFGPVRAKMEGRDPYLSAEIWPLFPDRLIDSERGEIPEGWSYGSILTLARLLSGGTPKTSEPSFWDGEIKWASAKDVSQCGETFLLQTERTITNLGLERSSTKLIPAFSTVIVARGATTGRLTMFGEEMAMNQTCYGLHSKFNAPFALYCHTRDFIDSMVSAAHGSVFDTITTQTFEATPVLLPSEKTLKAFDERASKIFSQILANLNQMRTLAITRDSLLPRLLSGELSANQIQGADCA